MQQPAKRPPLALVATDVEWASRSIESVLAARGFSIVRAYTGQQALERGRVLTPDLIILNAQLPDGSGVELCRALRQEAGIRPFTPILLTTPGPRTRAGRLEALAAGAWDFLSLPLDVEELWMRVDNYIQSKRAADRGWAEGLVDLDTGLYNEKGLFRRASEVASDAYRHARALACVTFDSGEPEGREGSAGAGADSTAERLADTFRSSGRVSDVVSRVHASRFVVLAPATDRSGAVKLAERILGLLDADAKGDGEPQRVRAGVYAVDDFRRAGIDVTTLISRASVALGADGSDRIRPYEGG